MRLVKWLIGIVITLGIILAVTPLVAKWYTLRWLESKGYHADIKKLGMDFIFGELRLQGVDVISPQGERLTLFDANLDFDLWFLLKDQRLVIDKLIVDSAQLDVSRSPQGLRVAGFALGDVLNRLSIDTPLEIRSAEWINTDVCRMKQQCLRMESIIFSRAKWQKSTEGWSFIHNAPLVVQKVFLRDQTSNATLFYGAEFNVGHGSYAPGFASLENVVLTNFQFVENSLVDAEVETPYQTQLGEMTLSSVMGRGGEDARIVVGVVDITSLRQSLHRNPDGKLVLPTRLRALVGQVDWGQVALVIESLNLRDGAVSWVDHSVSPPAMANLSALNLQVGGIDSSLPDRATAVKLSGKIGQAGTLKLEGDLYPYSPMTQFTLTGFVQGLNLTKLAGYSRVLLAQGVDQGQLDVSISAVARNNRIDADTRWQLANLRLEPTRGNSPSMPLELSYDLLKDHNNTVAVDLALRGEVGSERLTPKYIFGTQMRRVMSDMARRRVNAAGAVSSPARPAPSGKMAFRPLLYAVNARYPGDLDRERLREVASMLREKPHLSMVFCPVSTGGEWAELFNGGTRPDAGTELPPEQKQALLDLASARGRTLRAELIDAGVTSEQIVICTPSVDMTQFGLSFVSISL